MKLSVAIICKNEGRNIERCLQSVFAGLPPHIEAEVLVVDSFSTDNTLEIAGRFPVKIIRLGRNWPHSPAAGRYTAFRHARGAYTLCIDADMELHAGFLETALAFMDTQPRAAALTGIIKHTMLSTDKYECLNSTRGELPAMNSATWDARGPARLLSIPGAGLFRTNAVLAVGNFHPFLRAEEEYELSQRLRHAGHELWYLPCRIADHHGYAGDSWSELKRRWRRGFMKGMGEMFALSMRSGFARENIHRFRLYLVLGGYVLLTPLILLRVRTHPLYTSAWMAGAILAAILYRMRKKNWKDGLLAMVGNTIIGLCLYAKLLSRVPKAETYPAEPLIIDLTGSGNRKAGIPD